MPEIIFMAASKDLGQIDPEVGPTEHFVGMDSQGFDLEMRSQFYAIVMHSFREEAVAMEQLVWSLTDDGPWIYELDPQLVDRLKELEEDDIHEYIEYWSETEEAEERPLELDDLAEYAYLLVHFARTVRSESDKQLFIYIP